MLPTGQGEPPHGPDRQPRPRLPEQSRQGHHRRALSRYRRRACRRCGDRTSTRARLLSEPPYPQHFYIPFEDIDFTQLGKTALSTHCPYKGDASYWSVLPAGETGKDAMWAYERPFDEMTEIRDHGAFYPNRVTIEAIPS